VSTVLGSLVTLKADIVAAAVAYAREKTAPRLQALLDTVAALDRFYRVKAERQKARDDRPVHLLDPDRSEYHLTYCGKDSRAKLRIGEYGQVPLKRLCQLCLNSSRRAGNIDRINKNSVGGILASRPAAREWRIERKKQLKKANRRQAKS
jgi:hypothetical protein